MVAVLHVHDELKKARKRIKNKLNTSNTSENLPEIESYYQHLVLGQNKGISKSTAQFVYDFNFLKAFDRNTASEYFSQLEDKYFMLKEQAKQLEDSQKQNDFFTSMKDLAGKQETEVKDALFADRLNKTYR